MKSFAIDSLVAPDIEEIARIRATVPCCSLPCGRDCDAPSARGRLKVVQGGRQWIRPNSLSELFSIVAAQTQVPTLGILHSSKNTFLYCNHISLTQFSSSHPYFIYSSLFTCTSE